MVIKIWSKLWHSIAMVTDVPLAQWMARSECSTDTKMAYGDFVILGQLMEEKYLR